MGYYLQAILGQQLLLARHAAEFQHARVVALVQGIAMIPLTDDLYDEIGGGAEVKPFVKLSPGVEQWARRMSAVAPVAYIEAEFFGGTGGQTAIAWSRGAVDFGPIHSAQAINQALRHFGVQTNAPHDEFDAVGLNRYRDTNDWVARG